MLAYLKHLFRRLAERIKKALGKSIETPREISPYKFKQVIAVRADLGMSKGKTAAQVAHGAVRAAIKADEADVVEWLNTGEAKIVVRVDSEHQLHALAALADLVGFPNALIWDEGLTEIDPSYTVVAIGPAPKEKIDLITGGLKLL